MQEQDYVLSERNAEPEEYRRALHGLDYPASRDAIVRKAADHGGLDREVLYVLERIPERPYESFEDVQRAIDVVYETHGGLQVYVPRAAPTSADDADKRIVERNADPRAGESH